MDALGVNLSVQEVTASTMGRNSADSPGVQKGFRQVSDADLVASLSHLLKQSSVWSRKLSRPMLNLSESIKRTG